MKPLVPLSRARPLWLPSARSELVLFGIFALLVLGLGIGLRDPWPSDEPRFALVAHWMVQHGQWLFPHRGHELYPDKPPVFMWLQALGYLLTRSWRVAFMLPSLLAGLGALALIYDLARRLWNHRSALLAAATLLVTIHFTYQMRNAQIDPLELGWITLANYGLLRHLLLGPSAPLHPIRPTQSPPNRSGQDAVRRQGWFPWQELRRRLGLFGGLPKGEPLGARLLRCIRMKGNHPSCADAPCSQTPTDSLSGPDRVQRRTSWRWFAVGCFFAGVGVATKGVGVLALLMLLPYVFARRRGWNHLAVATGGWRWAGGLALFLVPILGWLAPMLLTARLDGDPQHAAYVQNILFGQTVHRYATPSGHIHSPFYFLGIIATDWLPLSLLLPWALPAWWRRIRRRDARFLLPLAWVVLIVIFFSISPGKRDVYILPALPMTALALAPLLPGLLRRRGVRLAVFILTVLLAGLLAVAAGLALHGHPRWALKIEQSLDPQIWWPLLTIGLAGLMIAAITRVRRAPLGWLVFAAVLWGVYGLWGYPLLNGDRSARDVMVQARTIAGPDATIGLLAWKEQNLLMAQGPVIEFGFLKPWSQQYVEATTWQRQDPADRWIFSLDKAMGDCVDRRRAIHVGHANRREWWMFRASAVKPGCVPNASNEDDD